MIRYKCDNCGEVTIRDEAVGNGIIPPKTYVFQDPDSGLIVEVNLMKSDTENQFCTACMWRVLNKMIDTVGPDDAGYHTADKDVPEVRPTLDVQGASPDEYTGSLPWEKWIRSFGRSAR